MVNLNSVLLEGTIQLTVVKDGEPDYLIRLDNTQRDVATNRLRKVAFDVVVSDTKRYPASTFLVGDLIRVVGRLRKNEHRKTVIFGEAIERAVRK
jgi:hypothetical protein